MAFLQKTFYHNTLDKWLTALVITAVLWLVLLILRKVVHHRLMAVALRTATPLDDLLALLIKKIHAWFSFAVSLYAGSLALTLPPLLAKVLAKAAILALLLQCAAWGTESITFWIGHSGKKKAEGDSSDRAVINLLHFLVRIVLWTAVVLLAMDNLGVHITTLIAGLGVGGVAVALAVQNILGDLFASVSIILDKPFLIGDFITIDDFQGTVEHIGLKTTRIRSLSGEQLVFPNGDLLKSRVRNYKRMAERRVVLSFGVVHQTDPARMEAIPGFVKEAVEAQPKARFERAHFRAFGDSSLDFEAIYWVTDPDYKLFMDVQQAVNLALLRRFQTEGIALARPTHSVILEQAKAAAGINAR
jgi:small-conductance mechanosensitive channel